MQARVAALRPVDPGETNSYTNCLDVKGGGGADYNVIVTLSALESIEFGDAPFRPLPVLSIWRGRNTAAERGTLPRKRLWRAARPGAPRT